MFPVLSPTFVMSKMDDTFVGHERARSKEEEARLYFSLLLQRKWRWHTYTLRVRS